MLHRITRRSTPFERRRLLRGPDTGRWLNVIPNVRNDTGLTPIEFRDSLRLRLGLTPLGLPAKCDGCGCPFTVRHALQCKKGNLVSLRHDDLKAVWEELLAEATKPSLVRDEPYIIGRAREEPPGPDHVPEPELRGDISTHGFWRRGIDTIFDVSVTDTDCSTYLGHDPGTVLAGRERFKRRKYGAICEDQRRHFTPLVYSVDGLVADKAIRAQKRLAKLLSIKWRKVHSACCGFVSARISITLVRTTSICLRNSRLYRTRWKTIDWGSGKLLEGL